LTQLKKLKGYIINKRYLFILITLRKIYFISECRTHHINDENFFISLIIKIKEAGAIKFEVLSQLAKFMYVYYSRTHHLSNNFFLSSILKQRPMQLKFEVIS